MTVVCGRGTQRGGPWYARHMRRGSPPLLAFGLLAGTLFGCGRLAGGSCDEAKLTEVAGGIEGGTVDEKGAVEGLAAACPKMPALMAVNLLSDYGMSVLPPDQQLELMRADEAWLAFRKRVCVDPSPGSKVAEVPADQRFRVWYETCDMRRFGLLEDGEPLYPSDMTAVLGHAWLLERGVDGDLARRIFRGLMDATATREVLARRCDAGSDSRACERLVGAVPSSTIDLPPQGGFPVRIDRSSITVGEAVTPLDDAGRVPANDVKVRVVRSLREAFAASFAEGEVERVHLTASGDTPYATVLETMYTARQLGVREFELAVSRSGQMRAIAVSGPKYWYAAPRGTDPWRPPLRFDGRELEIPVGSEFHRVGLKRDEALERALEDHRKARKTSVAYLAVADGVELAKVVELLDRLRGEDCKLEAANFDGSGEFPPECKLWQPALAFDEPVGLRPGDWKDLELTVQPKLVLMRRDKVEKLPMSDGDIVALFEAKKDALAVCLEQTWPAQVVHPKDVMVLLAARGKSLVVMASYRSGPVNDVALTGCIGRTMLMPTAEPKDLPEMPSWAVRIDVKMPTD